MKLTKQVFISLGILALGLTFIISACQKQLSLPANATVTSAKSLSVYLTDNPCQYDSVLIDIRYVEVKIDTSSHMNDDHFGDHDVDSLDDHHHNYSYGYWDTLAITPGVYNISNLRNGVDTLLGRSNIPAGAIRKIRLTLGTHNSLYIGGVSYPLNLLPGTSNYVYVKIHQEDQDDTSSTSGSVWVDFNICESVLSIGGHYYLRPVLRPFSMRNFGAIDGKVLPRAAQPYVLANSLLDSAIGLPEENGSYKIRGLIQGTYSVTFKGSNGYKDTTVSNIQVQNGVDTPIPTITLHQ